MLSRELKATQDRFSVGEVTRTDVAQAEARRADAVSDLESASGLWRTFPVPGDPEATDVLYAAQIVPKKGAARLFRKRIGKAGLKSATVWLTREAESR